jgi:prepilin-type N-terminal cleavage/methylation domain-containing protein
VLRSSAPIAGRAGFTLVELLVALVVGGVAILGARAVLAALGDQAERVSEAAASSDRTANGERTLRALVGNLEIGTTPDVSFGGDERQVQFTTSCPTASGWQERCAVRLVALSPDSLTGKAIVAGILPTGEILPLLTGVTGPRFRYLRDAGNGGTWFRTWGNGITAPIAVGIVTERDTLILRIGERG